MKKFLIIVLILLGLNSCQRKTYSFFDTTGFEINDIQSVYYNIGPAQSSVALYEGNYKLLFDTMYVESYLPSFEHDIDHYSFCFFVDFQRKDTKNQLNIYLLRSKLYLVGQDEKIYCSINKIYHPKDTIMALNNFTEKEVKNKSIMITYRYEKNQAILLFNDEPAFFNPKEYGIENVYAGCMLDVKYKGNLSKNDSFEILEIKIYYGSVVEFFVEKNENDDIILKTADERCGVILNSCVIALNQTWIDYKNLGIGTKIYGVNPAWFNSLNILILYSYNPI